MCRQISTNARLQAEYVQMVAVRTSWADMSAFVTPATSRRLSKLPVKAKCYLLFSKWELFICLLHLNHSVCCRNNL